MFKINQKIVCVDDINAPTIKKGEIYTIKGLISHHSTITGVLLFEADANEGYYGFKLERFRPIDDRGIDDLLTKLLKEAKEEII